MPKLRRDLSGSKLVVLFTRFGFTLVGQRGSHVKLKRTVGDVVQTLTIPNHKEIDIGTAREIFNQALRFISQAELHEHFYTE